MNIYNRGTIFHKLRDLGPKLTTQYNESNNTDASFALADDDYIDVTLRTK